MFAVTWHILVTADACRTQRPSEHMWRYSRSVWGPAAAFRQMWISADIQLPVSWWLCRQVSDCNVCRMLVIMWVSVCVSCINISYTDPGLMCFYQLTIRICLLNVIDHKTRIFKIQITRFLKLCLQKIDLPKLLSLKVLRGFALRRLICTRKWQGVRDYTILFMSGSSVVLVTSSE